MCEPATIAAVGGMALSAAGSYMQSREQSKNVNRAIQARNDVAEAERIRQQGYQDEADAAYRPSIDRFKSGNQQKAISDARINRQAKTEAAVADAGDYSATPTSGSAPDVVKTEVARKMHDATVTARTQAKALGGLNAWGDASFGNNRALNLNRGVLSEISRNAAGSAGLLQSEQNAAANNSQEAISGIGPALQLAGQAASLYGLTGAPGLGGGGAAPVTGTQSAAAGGWASDPSTLRFGEFYTGPVSPRLPGARF